MNIGARIKTRRLLKSKTLEWLAEQISTTRQTIHRYETGEISNIPSDKIELLAKALDTTPSKLMGWDASDEDDLYIKFEIQKINLNYAFHLAFIRHGSIISFFKYYYEKLNTKHVWEDNGQYVHSIEELINRYQNLYLKQDLITYEEQSDFHRVADFKCPDINDSHLLFNLDDINLFLSDYEEYPLYESNKSKNSDIYQSCIAVYRDLMILKHTNTEDISKFNKAINSLNSVIHRTCLSNFDDFNISIKEFLSLNYSKSRVYHKLNNVCSIPLYNTISCGNGLFVDDEVLEYITLPDKLLNPNKEYFCQYANGDSMINSGINNGDLIIFEKTNFIESGYIGCFCVDDNIATCKKYILNKDGMIYLVPSNDKMAPITVDPLNVSFRVVGRLVGVYKNLYND